MSNVVARVVVSELTGIWASQNSIRFPLGDNAAAFRVAFPFLLLNLALICATNSRGRINLPMPCGFESIKLTCLMHGVFPISYR